MNHAQGQIFWEYFDKIWRRLFWVCLKKHGENIDNPSISKQNMSYIKIIFKKIKQDITLSL